MNSPLERLRHHVTGAIERGEAKAIVEQTILGVEESDIEDFITGYITCALWSTVDEDVYKDGEGPDDALDQRFSRDDLHSDTKEAIDKDCREFIKDNRLALIEACTEGDDDYGWERAGHDYWLTRNGHGAGYWDRDELKRNDLGDRLSDACRHKECYIYVGDDGKLHI